jgi:hypothetical protein
MQKSNFYEFTRPVQERFIGSVNGTGMPTPILERRGGPPLPYYWLALSAVGLLVVIVLFPMGLGSLQSGLAIQSFGLLLVYVAGLFALVFGVMKTLAAWREVKALPFRPGVYVFPIGLVDARAYVLEIHPLSEIKNVEQRASDLVLSLEGGASYTFSFPSSEDVGLGAANLDAARVHLEQASSTRESLRPGAFAGIDPFHGAASPFVPNKALVREVPIWAKLPWAFALGAGVVVGLSIWLLRNHIGDRRLYTSALEKNDIAAYQAYLARGRRFRDEVERIRLPRAELRVAEKAGSVDAIEEYIHSHPSSAIPDEVQAARRTALLQELERSKEIGTVTALRDFDFRHPHHGLDAEVKKAIHQVYVLAFEKYRAEYAPKDPEAAKFMGELITVVEQKGPTALIRFHHKPSRTLEKADSVVAKSKYFNGTQSFPSRYFDAAHLQSRENDTAAVIVQRFSEAFPKDILSMQVGEEVAEAEGALPAVTSPTLFIEHGVEWAGGVSTSTNPRGVFIGAGMMFDASFRLPTDAKPRRFKMADWRAPDVSALKGEARPEEKLYEGMARTCFESFTKRLLATLFRAPPK